MPASFERDRNGRVRFRIGEWDRRLPLVIDPALSFVSGIGGLAPDSTYVGTTPVNYVDTATSVALDAGGNIYLAGLAYSSDFPVLKPLPSFQSPQFPACPSVFAAKISPDGQTLVYSTLLTACSSSPPAIAVDSAGNAYVTGTFSSSGLAQVGGGTVTPNGPGDAFVVKLDSGGALKAALTFGGSGADSGTSIVLGPDGKLYVAGTTTSADFPVSTAAFRKTISSSQDVFLMKLDPASLSGNQPGQNTVLYSTFLGQGTTPAVVADVAGNAWVAASTTSTAWPTGSGVFQPRCWGRTQCANVIALKLNAAGTQLTYATYVGGSGTDTLGGIAADIAGNLYIAGTTNSGDFPTTQGGYRTGFDPQSPRDAATAFVAKLSPDATRLTYATLLTAEDGLTGNTIAVDPAGNAYVGGKAVGTSLPPLNAIQWTPVSPVCFSYDPFGGPDGQYYCPQGGFLAVLNATGTGLSSATYLGSGTVNSIVLDGSGNAVVAGSQIAMRNTAASPSPGNNASVIKIAPAGVSLINIGIEEAAEFQIGLPAPGGLAAVYVFGVNVAGTFVAPGLPLPTQLGGFTVLVNGIPSPIVAVAGTSGRGNEAQVNIQVPYESAGPNPQANIVEVRFNGQTGFATPQQASAGIFVLPSGIAAIQHASDYSLVTLQNPVHPGETVIIYATGLGPVQTPVPSGMGATGPDPVVPGCSAASYTNAGQILYEGLTPGFPGLYQLNVQLSQYLASGVNYIYLASFPCWLNGVTPFGQSRGVALYVQ